MIASKRVYHPLVVLCSVIGELSDEHLGDVPKSTLSYWRNMQDYKSLHGYDWIAHFFDLVVERTLDHRVIRTLAIVYGYYDRLIDGMKGYKRSVKTQAKMVVNTVDRLTDTLSLTAACRLLRITIHEY